MEYVTIGSTGVRVSPLCLGTMTFGSEADEQTSAALFHRARDRGINFFDTADLYGQGRAEEILGGLIRDCRDELVITSKAFFPTGGDVNAQGMSRRHLLRSVEHSLRRLGTDRIDFYFVHSFDGNTGIEHTLRALDDLQRQGKIVYPAVSNWAAWQIATALGVSAREHLARFEIVQPMYNLVKRQAEVEILPLAAAEDLGVMTYSPLAAGLLTGKYRGGLRPAGGRLVENDRYADRYRSDSYAETADRFTAFAEGIGLRPATLAVAWVMTHPAVTAAIVGARDLAQFEDSLASLDLALTPDQREEISALAPTPAPATDRSEAGTHGWP